MKTQVLVLIALAGHTALASAESQSRRLRDVQGLLHLDVRPAGSLAFNNKAEDQLLHFLETERSLESSAASLPPYEDFMPACLEHTQELVHSVDESYTDMQLRKVLEDECLLDKQFTTVEDGFDDHQACMKFAKELSAARMKELRTGSDKGYKVFCERFFVHKGGNKPEKQENKDKKEKKTKTNKVATQEEENQPEPEKKSEDMVNAPAAAPVASPMAAPVASPIAAPGPAPEAGAAPAPKEAASIREDDEAASKCNAVYEAEYEKQMDMGRSKERAKKEAKSAKNKCLGIKSKGANKKKEKEDLIWWALALVLSGVVLFAVVGAIVHARNR